MRVTLMSPCLLYQSFPSAGDTQRGTAWIQLSVTQDMSWQMYLLLMVCLLLSSVYLLMLKYSRQQAKMLQLGATPQFIH